MVYCVCGEKLSYLSKTNSQPLRGKRFKDIFTKSGRKRGKATRLSGDRNNLQLLRYNLELRNLTLQLSQMQLFCDYREQKARASVN